MTHTEYPTIQIEQPPIPSETGPDSSATPKKKHGKKFWILIITAASILACMVICVSIAVLSIIRSGTEKDPIQKILGTYMTDMKNKDAEGAYELFTPRIKKKVPLSNLKELIHGNYYILFEGYQNIEINNIMMTKAFNTNPDLPQGDVATIKATIYYADGFVGKLDATMEKNNEKWTIYYVNVVVSPDKF